MSQLIRRSGPASSRRQGLTRHGARCGLALIAATGATAQVGPAAQPAPTTETRQPQATELVEPAPSEIYAYDPEGRRDPFVSPLTRGTGLRLPTKRPPGLPGLGINDLSLRGIVFSAGEHLAVIQSPDDRTYILHGGEQLFDAVVKNINAEGVVFLQDVNDPLSLVNEREVLRTLQGQEDGR